MAELRWDYWFTGVHGPPGLAPDGARVVLRFPCGADAAGSVPVVDPGAPAVRARLCRLCFPLGLPSPPPEPAPQGAPDAEALYRELAQGGARG